MPELDFIVNAKRKDIYNNQRFYAMFKGIDLDKESKKQQEEKMEAVRRRAAATLLGGEEELERQEFADFGFEFESA